MEPPKSTALFLLAPAGWGKTSLIMNIYKKWNCHILIISPLRALKEEISEKATQVKEEGKELDCVSVEKVQQFINERTDEYVENLLVVFDEIHLWNKWGSTFRERMWEGFYCISSLERPILGLSATLKEVYKKEWELLFEMGSYRLSIVDLGNGKLENRPQLELSFWGLGKKFFKRRLLYELERGERALIFCKYRKEAQNLSHYLRKRGIKNSLCLGGETLKYYQYCKQNGFPRVTIATSALGHGVNLGEVKKVFISYEIFEWDTYLQMKARGGRRGGSYQVFCYQRSSFCLLKSIKAYLFDLYLRLFYA